MSLCREADRIDVFAKKDLQDLIGAGMERLYLVCRNTLAHL